MSYTPTTDEVRGAWIALTHAPEAFDRWIEGERERIIDIIDKGTGHYAKTHSGRTECKMCDLFLEITGNGE